MGPILIILLPILLEWLQTCMGSRSRRDIEAGLNNPGFIERRGLIAVLRQERGLRGKELRKEVKRGMNELRTASRKDIAAVMDEVGRLLEAKAANAA